MKIFNTFFCVALSFLMYAQAPTAQFSASPLVVCVGQPVTFTNLSTTNGSPIVSYNWDFGDGNFAETANATHAFTLPGPKTITLTVQAQDGSSDFEFKAAYIMVNPNPAVSFSTSANGCAIPVGVTFTNTSANGNFSYAWNFGNSQTSTQQNPPMVMYNTAGTYAAALTVTNTLTGCTSTLTQPLIISNFAAGITAPATACVGTTVTFQDNSSVGANAWSWNLGNGNSTQENPSTSYGAPGTYTITLTSQNTSSACSSTATQQITILPSPVPAISAAPTSGCAPLPVTFSTTTPGSNYVWNFGDGGTFNGQNPPVHTYQTEDTFTVSLGMTGANGCPGFISIVDMILTGPAEAQFDAPISEGCAPLLVSFYEYSTIPTPTSSPIVSWHWDFGDGNTFDGQTPPPHEYADLGLYDVSLTITTQSGCTNTLVREDFVEVGAIDFVGFTVTPPLECAKKSFVFDNQTIISAPHDPEEVNWTWDYGDGGSGSAEDPTYNYPLDTGWFDVSLFVDFRGCIDTFTLEDAVFIKAPIAKFLPSTAVICNPQFPVQVDFLDQSIQGALTDDVTLTWRFGNGAVPNVYTSSAVLDDAFLANNSADTSHVYTAYGEYVIRQVIVNTTTGCADSVEQNIIFSELHANFIPSNDSVCKGLVFDMTDASTTFNGNATMSAHPIIQWTYSNGVDPLFEGPDYSTSYDNAGFPAVTLGVENSVGCTDIKIIPIRVLEHPRAVISAASFAGCAPFHVTFVNQSIPQGNGAPLGTFVWGFSDQASVTTPNLSTPVNHTYNVEDTFEVVLVATDLFGCVSQPDTVEISVTKPVAAFTVDPVVCDLEIFGTQNNSTGVGTLSYEWLLDNTPAANTPTYSSSFDETPSASYTNVQHHIQLIATDGNGCKDTLEREIRVSLPIAGIHYELDGASINANGDYNCPPVFATFVDGTENYGNITSWQWDFGDGKQSTLENPGNTYVFPGTYTATLAVTDEFGCTSDTALVEYLTIFGPSANAVWMVDGDLCGQEILFELQDTMNITEVLWNTGDGNFTNDSISFSYAYEDVATYTPSVTVKDVLGCEVIYPLPPVTIPDIGLDAYFVATPPTADIGSNVLFDDQSTGDNEIVSWEWNFGNGASLDNTTDETVSNAYYVAGSQVITLTITDENGCKDVYKLLIQINGNFEMPNVLTPNGDGANDTFTIFADIFKTYDILILNRWGNVIQEHVQQTGGLLWDGKNMNGEQCSDGVYFYVLNGILKDGTSLSKNGFVTLIASK